MPKSLSKTACFILLIGLMLLMPSACNSFDNRNNGTDTVVDQAITTAANTVSEGNLVPRESKYLFFARNGRVAEVLVAKGELVSQDQVLARLADREQGEASLAAAELEQISAQQALDELQRTASLALATLSLNLVEAKNNLIAAQRQWDLIDSDDYQNDLDEANVKVEDAKTKQDEAQDAFDKYKNLASENANRKKAQDDLDKAQDAYQEALRGRDALKNQSESARALLDQATANVTEAQRKVDASRSGPDAEKLALAEARLKNAKAQLAAARASLEYWELKAPFSGKIVDINIVKNEQAAATTWAFLLADFSEWYVDTNDLTELEVVDLKVGESATMVPDAIGDLSMSGEITEIADYYNLKAGDIQYKVRLKINDPDPRLKWGMTVEITFPNSP